MIYFFLQLNLLIIQYFIIKIYRFLLDNFLFESMMSRIIIFVTWPLFPIERKNDEDSISLRNGFEKRM